MRVLTGVSEHESEIIGQTCWLPLAWQCQYRVHECVANSSGVSNQGKIESDSLQSSRFYKPMFGA